MALASSVCTVASVALLLLAGTEPSRASAVLASRRCWSAEGVGHVVLLLLACCCWSRDFLRARAQPSLLCVQACHFGLQARILHFHNLTLCHKDCRLLLLLISAFSCGYLVPLASSSSSIFVLRGEILNFSLDAEIGFKSS